ncbi:MAG: hypothetical protein AAGI48_12080 [Verrucomicrobiota bacterium]
MNNSALIELKCRNCGSQLSPENISAELSAARCTHCNALFALPASVVSKPIARPQAPLPSGFEIHTAGNGVQITRRWRSARVWFLLFFAIFWNGFLVVWHGIAISQGQWLMSAFGLIHTAVGVGLIYTVAAMFLNSTVIRCENNRILVHHGPLPWKGNKTMATEEIEQLYCTEKITRSKNGTSTRYRIEAVLKGNRRETLLKGVDNPDQALFIEQQLEKALGIVDRPVDGEHGR